MKPSTFLFAKNEPGNSSVDNLEFGVPANVAATQHTLSRFPIKRKYPLFSIWILEISGVLIVDSARDYRSIAAFDCVMVTNGQ